MSPAELHDLRVMASLLLLAPLLAPILAATARALARLLKLR